MKRKLKKTIPTANLTVFELGTDEMSAAKRLYKGLRELDAQNVDVILAEGVKPVSLGATLMDRLTRACCGKIVNEVETVEENETEINEF